MSVRSLNVQSFPSEDDQLAARPGRSVPLASTQVNASKAGQKNSACTEPVTLPVCQASGKGEAAIRTEPVGADAGLAEADAAVELAATLGGVLIGGLTDAWLGVDGAWLEAAGTGATLPD